MVSKQCHKLKSITNILYTVVSNIRKIQQFVDKHSVVKVHVIQGGKKE